MFDYLLPTLGLQNLTFLHFIFAIYHGTVPVFLPGHAWHLDDTLESVQRTAAEYPDEARTQQIASLSVQGIVCTIVLLIEKVKKCTLTVRKMRNIFYE